MSFSPAAFLVPALDIDLAWHSHQLQGKRYMVRVLLKMHGQKLMSGYVERLRKILKHYVDQ